jgi:hypothetical protein
VSRTEDDNQSSGSAFGGMASNSLTFCHGLAYNCQISNQQRLMTWHYMTNVDKGELFAHHNIHFESHTEDGNQSSSSAWVTRLPAVRE